MNIIHINHSSLLIHESGYNLITDPWYFTNAFDGWAPFPQPDARLIEEVLSGQYHPHIVLISHAHDDHLDESFLAHLSDKTILALPKNANKSLKSRICRCGINECNIIEVGTENVSLYGFNLSSICNQTLSKQDFIFTISTSTGLVIHANDNWHPFSDTVVRHLVNVASLIPMGERYLFAQVGVADSFPLFYSGLTNLEKTQIIRSKCEKMLSALVSNGNALQINNLFAYANQSLFSRQFDSAVDPYLIRDQAIHSFSSHVKQLSPSSMICGFDLSDIYMSYLPLITQRLKRLAIIFEQFIESKISRSLSKELSEILPVKFLCEEYLDLHVEDSSSIQIISSLHQWNKILCGSSNLESIITGGCGRIYLDKAYNMRVEYGLLVDWSYILQAQIKSGNLLI